MEKLSPRKIPAKRGGRQYSCPRRPWRCGTAQQLAGWVLAALALANTAPAADSPPVFDAANVQAWADATFKPALARHEFSGLVVSVVRDGQTLFAQGYGRADFASPAPVNPAGTLFRIGSITKTFTATLIAMLIDEGKIGSLDDPANRYLRDYQLPDNDGVAITLHHLATHIAGFEDRFFFIGADRPTHARLPAAGFDTLRPAYVRPAGSRVVYSNFGFAVLGRIVEDITGLPIDVAMRDRLLRPLGMNHSRLLVDVAEPAGLGKPATIGSDGNLRSTPYTAINPAIASAGSLVTTGEDMTRYMLAQLGDRPADAAATILLPDRVRALLHDRRAGNAPETTGVGMAFFDENWGPWRTVAHGGNWEGFHSWMVLIPALDAGVFISVMSEAAPPPPLQAVRELFAPGAPGPRPPAVTSGWAYTQKFLRHFLGERRALPAPGIAFDAAPIDGWYLPDRRVFSTAESVADLVYLGAGALEVTTKDGALELGGAGPWRPAGNGVFVLDAPARNHIVIRQDERVDAPVLIPDLGIYTLTRIPAWENPRLHARIFILAIAIALVAWLLLLLSARRRGIMVTAASATALICGALPVVAAGNFFAGKSMLESLHAGHAGPLGSFMILANLLAVISVLTLLLSLRASAAPRRSRNLSFLIALCGLMIAAVLARYHVIGWQGFRF